AELQVSIDARVPNEFLLYIPTDGVGYKAVVQWRRGDKLGVMFLGTEPKPHWHYG
ncbi:PilZ domain-containing protein, partial [Mesorhizobium sp. M1C.F.Ca.ET.144.01.1.1]